MAQPTGLMPRQPERRNDNRRHEDAGLHYALQALAQAALVEAVDIGALPHGITDHQAELVTAAVTYRAACLAVEGVRDPITAPEENTTHG